MASLDKIVQPLVDENVVKPMYVWITTQKLDAAGLKYVLQTPRLLVIPWQSMAAYLPAMGNRLILKAKLAL